MVFVGAVAGHAAETAKRSADHAAKSTSQAAAATDDVDSEHIFGFTAGSDIGQKGEVELEVESEGAWGKRAGRYLAATTNSYWKVSVTDHFRISPGFSFGGYKISGVPGLDDIASASVQRAAIDFRYRLWDRQGAPFGFTLFAEPTMSRIDEISGHRAAGYSGTAGAIFDKDIIARRLFGALNFSYGVEKARLPAALGWSSDSSFGVAGALTCQIRTGVLLGAEIRSQHVFEGLALGRRKGHAVFVGPNFSIGLTDTISLSGAWSVQAFGREADSPAALELENFERHQGLLRMIVRF